MPDLDNNRGGFAYISEALRELERTFDSTKIVEKATNLFFDEGGFEELEPEENEALRERFARWLNDFSILYDDGKTFALEALPTLFQWKKLAVSHFESANREVAFTRVVDSVYAGRGFVQGGRLGGNLFFDVVLSNACQARQNKAIRAFGVAYDEPI